MAGGVLGLSGITVPVIDTDDDQEALLALAEAAMRAEYGVLDRPVPAITRLVRAGAPIVDLQRLVRQAFRSVRVVAPVPG